jgi:hypothetical protein
VISPTEILAEYEEALTFTFLDNAQNLMLAHLAATETDCLRYVVAPTSEAVIGRLKTGAISIRRALEQNLLWVVDVQRDGQIVKCWSQKFSDLPTDAVPDPDVMLYPELEPMIRLRATGNAISPGTIPTATVRSAVAGVENAVRKLTDYIRQKLPAGRPSEGHRQFYRLEVQEIAFGSLSIAFRSVKPPAELIESVEHANVISRIEDMLVRGLKWSQTGESPSGDIAEAEAIFEAIREISPGRGATAEVVEVSGRVADKAHGLVRLTRSTRELATDTIKNYRIQLRAPDFVTSLGVVREADKDASSFRLRNRPDQLPELNFFFSDEQADDVMDAFYGDYQVFVTGRPAPGNRYELLQIIDVNARGGTPPT